MKSKMTFNLIKSLSKNEKGYFSKQLARSNSNYGDLFKVIESQQDFNNQAIKKALSGDFFCRTLFSSQQLLISLYSPVLDAF